MMKYYVSVKASTTVFLGEVDADNKNEAIQKAVEEQGDDTIQLCWGCSQQVGEIKLSDKDEDFIVVDQTQYFDLK